MKSAPAQMTRGTLAAELSAVSGFSAYLELTKPRVTTMVVLTTAAGFYLGTAGAVNWILLINTLLGTALLAGGTAVLNQYMERDSDSRMHRTMDRPVPAGRVDPLEARVLGMFLVTVGTVYLLLTVNLLTALLGWLTSTIYLLAYTPLKRRSSLCTLVGAVPGAIPPLMGWTASRGEIDLNGLLLFLILFSWQFPHFLAIAWIYRDDYERGGLRMLPSNDPEGWKTGWKIRLFSLGLLFLSIVPFFTGLTGLFYLGAAALLGMVFVWSGFRMASAPNRMAARLLLRTSVIYLPLLLLSMTLNKTQ